MLDDPPKHHPDDIPEHKDKVLWVLYVPVCIVICIVGILGNILSVMVWRRFRAKSRVGNLSTTIYFMVLSFVDIGVLLTTPLVMTLPYANENLMENYAYAVFFSYIGHPIHFFLIFVSIYMVVGMCIDRVRLVFRPFSRYSKNQKYTYLGMAIFTGISFFLNIPTFFEFRPQKDPDTGIWSLKEIRYLHRREFRDAVFTTHCIGVIFIPWTVMFLSNVLLVYKSSRRLKKVRSMVVSNEEEPNIEHRHLTYTLILVTLISMILLAVQCVARCITMFYYIDNKIWPRIHFGRELGNLTLPLNSALNILLFCFPGRRFRRECVKTLKDLFRRNRRVAPSSHTSFQTTRDSPNFITMPKAMSDLLSGHQQANGSDVPGQ